MTGCKIQRGIDLLFRNWHEVFDEFWPEELTICALMGRLWAKYIMFELKKHKKLYLMALKINAKFERKLICALSNDMKNLSIFTSQTISRTSWLRLKNKFKNFVKPYQQLLSKSWPMWQCHTTSKHLLLKALSYC